MPANIKLGLKGMAVANTLAYYNTDKQTVALIHRVTDRQADRQSEKQTGSTVNSPRHRQAYRGTDIQRYGHTERWTYRETDIQRDGQTAPLTHRVVHLEIEQVEGASLALQQVLGLLDDGGHQTLKTHLFLEEAPGQGEEKLEEKKTQYD